VYFLLPSTTVLSKARDPVLWVFMLGAYVIAPVTIFGVILCTIGYAQAMSWWARAGYLAMFLVVQLLGLRLHLVPLG
jgi:hypothetical protein